MEGKGCSTRIRLCQRVCVSPDGLEKSSNTLGLPGRVGLYFSWSKQAELGWPPAPSPIPVRGGGAMLLRALLFAGCFHSPTKLRP